MGTAAMSRGLLVLAAAVLAVAVATPGADCDGDLECLKRAHAVLMADLEKETYLSQNLTIQSDTLSTQVAAMKKDMQVKTDTHAKLVAEVEQHQQAADVLKKSLEESQKIERSKGAALAEAKAREKELALQNEQLKKDTETRKAETAEALERLTLVKHELTIRGAESKLGSAQEKELEDAAEEAKEEQASKAEVPKRPAAKKTKPCCEEKDEGTAFLELNAQLEAAGVCQSCK